MVNKDSFAATLTALLAKNNMRMAELARRVNMPYSTLWQAVNGVSVPHPDYIGKMAEVLGTPKKPLMALCLKEREGRPRKAKKSWPKNRRVRYTVYNNKTDFPVIVDGTAQECAKAMGMTIDSFYCALARFKRPRKTQRDLKWTFVKTGGKK